VLSPILDVVRRHYDIRRARPPSPNIQILPFQKRIDRPPQVEGKRMALDPEKQYGGRRGSNLPNGAGESALLTGRLVAWDFNVNQIPPRSERANDNANHAGRDCAARRGPRYSPHSLDATSQKHRHADVGWQNIVRSFEFSAREHGDDGHEPQ
jgi:hypothetical protein